MSLLKGGVDTSVIALWLGHEGPETTQIYLHADMSIKEQALARVQQPGTNPGRYRPPDTLLTSSTTSSLQREQPGYAGLSTANYQLTMDYGSGIGIIRSSA